ncbi:MAG TPA: flavodoxin [Armatimonadetes bacterium]|nr:flavodoxin [Armatimonadota bacterium]
MAKILVVYHSLGGNTEVAAKAVAAGAASVSGTEVVLKKALEATEEDLLQCDGIAVGSLDAFSYMAGGLKDFFDRTYYPTQGQVTGKPYVAFLTHGGGGRAIESIENLCQTFRFAKVAEPVLVQGRPDAAAEAELKALGAALARAAEKEAAG